MAVWLVAVIILLLCAAVFAVIFGKLSGRGEELPPVDTDDVVIPANAEAISQGQYDQIVFDNALRGYRQVQVDAAFDALLAQLEQARTAAAAAQSSAGAQSQQVKELQVQLAAQQEATAQQLREQEQQLRRQFAQEKQRTNRQLHFAFRQKF